MALRAFAYLSGGVEGHRGTFDTGLSPQRFAEEVAKLDPRIPGVGPAEEIWVWAGTDTAGQPDGIVVRQVA